MTHPFPDAWSDPNGDPDSTVMAPRSAVPDLDATMMAPRNEPPPAPPMRSDGAVPQRPTPGGDRGVNVPRPGGRRAARPLSSEGALAPVAAVPPADLILPSASIRASGVNPLVRAANPLLSLVVPLRESVDYADIDALRHRLIDGVRRFELDARTLQLAPEIVLAARYALCTLLDETVASTPWGGSGAWSGRSLLVTFHNEASGGERFFVILQRLAQDPRTHVDALELMYVCLALGLEGRYRLIDGGREQLEVLRERLLQIVRAQRGSVEYELSPHWQGVQSQRAPLLGLVPMWVMIAAAGVLLVLLHLSLNMALNRDSDPVFAALHNVKLPPSAPVAPVARAPVVVPTAPRLSVLLATDIAAGLVSVDENDERSIVTLRGDGLFTSGSVTLTDALQPLVLRIADALRQVPGRVSVVGHTDSQRMVSARFPSNWHLSQARAASVLQVLAARTAQPERFTAEGRGDTEPRAPNDTAAQRALNRRVDVVVYPAGS